MTTELNPSPASEPQGSMQAHPQNGAPQSQNPQGQNPQGQGQGQKQKSGKRFFQKSPGNQGSYGSNGSRPMPGNGNGNAGGRRKNKGGRRQQVFVGPMDHSYRGGANGNVADPVTHSSNGDFRGMPHSGFYSETDYVQPVAIREDAPTRIYCFIEDLFILAKIQEVSKKLGIKVAFLKPEKDVVTKLAETREEDRPALILFDLNNANAKPLTLIPKIKTKLKRGTSIIGFLAHIQGELKSKAIEVGCDTVMPRSTFSQNLPSLLRRYGSIEEAEDERQVIQA
jgi:CheY-like chemotaxis protein